MVTTVCVRVYWCFIVAVNFVNCYSVSRVQLVFKFHVVVHFYCAIARILFYFVAFNYVFQFDYYGDRSCQHAERLTWRGGIRLSHALRRCTRMYFCLLRSQFIASIHTGAPYVSRGRIAPLYMVAIAACLIPHVIFAAFDRLWISVEHLSASYFMCSWNLNLWSRIILKYFIWVTWSNGLLFRETVMFLCFFSSFLRPALL